MVTYTNASENDWHLSKCKRVLQSVYRSRINQLPRFLRLPTRFSNFCRVPFNTTLSITRKVPDRSRCRRWNHHTSENNWFYDFINVPSLRLGIMVPDRLIISKMYCTAWNFFCKRVTNVQIFDRVFFKDRSFLLLLVDIASSVSWQRGSVPCRVM